MIRTAHFAKTPFGAPNFLLSVLTIVVMWKFILRSPFLPGQVGIRYSASRKFGYLDSRSHEKISRSLSACPADSLPHHPEFCSGTKAIGCSRRTRPGAQA